MSATSEPVPWKANQTSGRWIVPPPDPDAIERALREAKRHEPPATSKQEPSAVTAMIELTEVTQGKAACRGGHHAYTPWTPPNEKGVCYCWCARGCGFWLRSDELQ